MKHVKILLRAGERDCAWDPRTTVRADQDILDDGVIMEVQREGPTEEITRLRRCIDDLVSVLALPAVWSGSGPSQILSTLVDTLAGILSLNLVYVQLNESAGREPLEIARVVPASKPTEPQKIGELLQQSLGQDPQKWVSATRTRFDGEEISVVPIQLGQQGEIGVIAVGARRADFPNRTEQLVLSAAANQAVIGLHEAHLRTEQTPAQELDRRIAERTAELAATNETLRREIAERKVTEEKLRLNEQALRDAHAQFARSEERWRSVFKNSAVGVALTDLNGRFIATNPVYQKLLGYAEEELQQLSFLDITHEDYLVANRALVAELLEGKRREFQIEKQCRRKNGSLVWVSNNVSIVPGTEGVPQLLMALSEDITERKQAEEALRARERNLSFNINAMPTLLASARPDGHGDFFNQRWLEYTGLSEAQLQGWGWVAPIHPDDVERLLEVWRSSLVSGAPVEEEARMRRRDGVYRWHMFRANALRDESGRIVKWYGTNADIDDRKRAEEQLRRSEAFLAEGQRLSSTGSFAWRVATDEITWSEETYRIFEIEPGVPLTHELFYSRIHPEDLPTIMEHSGRFRQDGGDVQHDFRLLLPDQSVKYIHVLGHYGRDGSGQLEYCGTFQDVTHRRLAEDALAKARTELANMARVTSLGMLTASLAHEVSQPLSGIITNANTCLRMLGTDPPNIDGAQETIRRALRDGNRASEVITRLRALFSRKQVTAETLDLNEVTREVVALSLGELQRNRVLLRTDFQADLPSITGDRVQLQQVILNLLRNASDAMSTVDERPRQLLVRTEREKDDNVRLMVQDVGVGFDPRAMDKLFQPFYTTKNEGMGMGLSVSRSIIESHHGRLWATRNDGPGATFSFSIPFESVATTGTDKTDGETPRSANAQHA